MTVEVTPELLQQIAEASKLDISFVTEEYNRLKAEDADMRADGVPDTEAVLYNLTTALKAHRRSPAVMCEGVILGMSDPFDYEIGHKNTQKRFLAAELQAAHIKTPSQEIIQKLIDKGDAAPESTPGSIIYLDTKAVFKSGKANPNYGKPWKSPLETVMMTIYGGAKPSKPVNGQDVPIRKFDVLLSDPEYFQIDLATNRIICILDLQPGKAFKAKLIFDSEHSNETHNVFRFSSLTKVEYFGDIDVLGFCNHFLPESVKTVTSLHEHYEKFGDNRDDFVIFEGGVQNMVMKLSPIGTRKLYVDDPTISPLAHFTDEGIVADTKVEVPAAIPLNFARGTRAVICGTTKKETVKEKVDDTWVEKTDSDGSPVTELVVNAYGVHPIPRYTVKAPAAAQIQKAAETDGW